jgi:tryptophan synthase beta chain
LAKAFELAKSMTKEETILICLSGRGDKDVHTLVNLLEGKEEEHEYV